MQTHNSPPSAGLGGLRNLNELLASKRVEDSGAPTKLQRRHALASIPALSPSERAERDAGCLKRAQERAATMSIARAQAEAFALEGAATRLRAGATALPKATATPLLGLAASLAERAAVYRGSAGSAGHV